MSFELPNADKFCKFTGFEKKCRELVCSGKCTDNWTNIQGMHPQTGEKLNKWGCSSEFAYLMAMEAARNANASEAASLTLRNMIFDPEVRARELSRASDPKLIEAS